MPAPSRKRFLITTGDEVGRVVTVPVTCAGTRLTVSADAAGGELKVGVLDADGLALSECRPITSDVTDQPVVWAKGGDLSPLKGNPIRLVFELKNAKLYAFGFAE